MKKKICCLCGQEYEGWGNNPYPLATEGECCDSCNMAKVIPARIFGTATISKKEEEQK